MSSASDSILVGSEEPQQSGSTSKNPASSRDQAAPTPAGGSSGPKRAYRACAHCRGRKSRCDLGDINAPRDPPCSRCRREGVVCEFLVSRRGGRVGKAAVDKGPVETVESVARGKKRARLAVEEEERTAREQAAREEGFGETAPSAMGHISSLESSADGRPLDGVSRPYPRDEYGFSAQQGPTSLVLPPPISGADLFRHTLAISPPNAATSPHGESSAKSESSGIVNREAIVASLRNPSEALELLALAADGQQNSPAEGGLEGKEGREDKGAGEAKRRVTAKKPAARLDDFPLVASGIITPTQLCELVDIFFSRCHFIFPVVTHSCVPRTAKDVARFASEEPHLTTTFCVIASRHFRNPHVHNKSWEHLQKMIADINLGKSAPVGAVEALLILSEFLPRSTEASSDNSEENRLSFMLVGTALRLSHMLGLDQHAGGRASPGGKTPTEAEERQLHREKLAWTYCSLFDRQISIRTGKIASTNSLLSEGGRSAAANNYPSMRFNPRVQDDFASLIQAYVELTQLQSTAHDVLYATRGRGGRSQVDYPKYISLSAQALESFRQSWSGKRWATYPLTECVWIYFHYVRLYVHAYALQAHIQRVATDTSSPDSPPRPSKIFPNGLMSSPDALFILEAIDAAADLLRLVTDRLHPGGALPYLPGRYFGYFAFAGAFLLKAIFVDAVSQADRDTILRLLKRLIFVLAACASNELHPGVRYARLLNSLLRNYLQGQSTQVTALPTIAPTPARRGSFSAEAAELNLPQHSSNPQLDSLVLGWANATSTAVSPNAIPAPSELPATLPFDFGDLPAVADSTLGTNSTLDLPTPSTAPFPFLPFAESQPFHALANALSGDQASDSAFDLSGFGLDAGTDWNAEPGTALNFLLDDGAGAGALDNFWSTFDPKTGGDWAL